MRRVLMAGAPIPVSLHEDFRKILPAGAQIHTPYGATESLPVASIGTDEVLGQTQQATRAGAGTCVGRPAPWVSIRIIQISDEPIAAWSDALMVPQGAVGEITVKGPVVTREYKNEPEQTAAAKIDDGGEIVHRIGDLGYFDAEGRLWFCGRKSHRVVTSTGETLFTVPCEAVFNEHPDVYRSALIGVNGEPRIVVELEPHVRRAKVELELELLELARGNARTESIRRVHFHPAFPVDVRHNAKIHRPQLAEWAARL